MPNKLKILFLCTGNSCRSQMAEGFARQLKADLIDAYSAGTAPQALNPNAVVVMREAGVDLSAHSSKHIDSFKDKSFDYIVTVCDDAHEHCPYWPGIGKIVHRSFEDPPKPAAKASSNEEALKHYRRIRDEIKEFILNFPKGLS